MSKVELQNRKAGTKVPVARGGGVLSSTRERAVPQSGAKLLLSKAIEGKGNCGLYEDKGGKYFVRTTTNDGEWDIAVSLATAAKIYEVETRWGLDRLIAKKLEVHVRVEGDDGSVYDTAKDKLLYKESWYYEGVSAHETSNGGLYFRFVDAHETTLLVLKERGTHPDVEALFGEQTNERIVEFLSHAIELWCGSDRTYARVMDRASEVIDQLNHYEFIVVPENATLSWASLLRKLRNLRSD